MIDVPPILVGFRAVKATCLQPKASVRHPSSDYFIRDVSRVLYVMTERGLRELCRRDAVRVRYRSQGGITNRSKIKIEHRVFSERTSVLKAKFH